MATATITVHALCYMAVLDGSTVAITGVLYSAIAMADRTFDPRVRDRAIAKKIYGKGSVEEQLLKLFVNGSYGKIAQDVIEKTAGTAGLNIR